MMENWTKEFFAFCEALSDEIDGFLGEMEQVTQEWTVSLDDLVQEVEETVNEELEFVEEVFELLLAEEREEEEANLIGESESYITSKLNPDVNNHPACRGCSHYHGYVYNGNLFVCGMHPYGWEDENCPDWEE